MYDILQIAITAIIVVAAVVYAIVKLLRRRKGGSCGTDSSCAGCPLIDKCDKPKDAI